jgi:hypothetical protein
MIRKAEPSPIYLMIRETEPSPSLLLMLEESEPSPSLLLLMLEESEPSPPSRRSKKGSMIASFFIHDSYYCHGRVISKYWLKIGQSTKADTTLSIMPISTQTSIALAKCFLLRLLSPKAHMKTSIMFKIGIPNKNIIRKYWPVDNGAELFGANGEYAGFCGGGGGGGVYPLWFCWL